MHPSTIPDHFLSDASTNVNLKEDLAEETNITEDVEDNKLTLPSKYRKILPKESQRGENGNQLSKHKLQYKDQSSASSPYPKDDIFQYTRYV